MSTDKHGHRIPATPANEVAIREEQLSSVITSPPAELPIETQFMNMLERMATDPNADATKARVFFDMRADFMKEKRMTEFDQAHARIKKYMRDNKIRIVKTRTVGYDIEKGNKAAGQKEAFKYAAVDDIDPIIGPLLEAEGITDSYTMESIGSGWYNVTCTLKLNGHREKSTIPMPLDTSGGKNNTQGSGSTMSYGKRHSLVAALGLTIYGQDNDGAGAPVTNEQAVELDKLLTESGMDKAKFLALMKVEDVRAIPTKEYGRAKNALEAALYRKQKAGEVTHA